MGKILDILLVVLVVLLVVIAYIVITTDIFCSGDILGIARMLDNL